MDQMSINEYFAGKSILVTGGTGFMGKILIEKLIRSCTQIKNIYVLIRSYKGVPAQQRLEAIFELPLFDRLKQELPGGIEKVKVVEGDITLISLGLSPEDKCLIKENVSVIFHVAASVRFDEPLTDAIIKNTRSTREVLRLAKEVKHLDVLLYVSTTYSNCYQKTVEEVIYPPTMNWKEAIFVAENCNKAELNVVCSKFLGVFPNTYVLSKHLAEHLLEEEHGTIPTVIVRPSIVISTEKEPMPGWIDNFNGPVGLLVGIGKGVIRITYTRNDTRADYMPVDISIKGMIVAAWKKATEKNNDHTVIDVYNSSSGHKSITMYELLEMGMQYFDEYPFSDTIWIPSVVFTQNSAWFYVNTIVKQVLPAIVIDWIIKLIKKKPLNLFKIQRKIYDVSMALSYFTSREWHFINNKFLDLLNDIPSCDKEAFDFYFDNVDPKEYLGNAVIGGHRYLLRTDLSNIPIAIKRQHKLKIISNIIKITFWCFVLWTLYNYVDAHYL